MSNSEPQLEADDRKVVQALFHTLMEVYGNELVCHPDGTTFGVERLHEAYMRDKPTGKALMLAEYESTLDTLSQEILGEINVEGAGEAYVKFRDLIQEGIQKKFPCTKFNF